MTPSSSALLSPVSQSVVRHLLLPILLFLFIVLRHLLPHVPVPISVVKVEVGQLVGVLGGGVDAQPVPQIALPEEFLDGEAEQEIWSKLGIGS